MNPLRVFGATVLGPSGPTTGPLVAEDGKIVAIGSMGGRDPALPSTRISADGLTAAPGFIDLQINGGHGIDLVSEPERLWELGRLLPQYGVTAFLPTIISSAPDAIERAVATINARPDGYLGAEPLGLHLEGPMLNPERAGAHDRRHLQPPSPDLYRAWSRAGGVAMVTLAPELPGAPEAITALTEAGVVVSLGHTNVDAAGAAAAVTSGATMVTHLFNAMAPLGHREPNLAGFALADGGLAVGCIVDGVHVDPLVVSLAWKAIGPGRFVLVSDAVAAMGLGPGRHRLGRREVLADGISVRTSEGTLAGSNLTLDVAVANLMAYAGVSLDDAVVSATAAPAAVLGDDHRGWLEAGARADLVLLDQASLPAITVCGGHPVFVAPDHAWRVRAST